MHRDVAYFEDPQAHVQRWRHAIARIAGASIATEQLIVDEVEIAAG